MAAKQNRNLIKNQRAKLKRRVIKIFENSNEIHLIHKAEVYALLESEGKFYMYCSSVEKGFPLSPAQLRRFGHDVDAPIVVGTSRLEKRIQRLFASAERLLLSCNAKVFIHIKKEGRYFSLRKAGDVRGWPPTKRQLEGFCSIAMRKEPSNYEDDVTPIIVNLPPPVDDSSLPGPEFNIVGEDDGFDAILALRDYC